VLEEAKACSHALYPDIYTLLPTTMKGPSKETVQRKPNFGDKLKDRINNIKGKFSRAPSPQPSRTVMPGLSESSKTGGDAGVGKRLRLDCQQGLMSETNIQQGRGPTQILQLRLSIMVEIYLREVAYMRSVSVSIPKASNDP
jgi:hypothetical protein